jgi:hypothetical protein
LLSSLGVYETSQVVAPLSADSDETKPQPSPLHGPRTRSQFRPPSHCLVGPRATHHPCSAPLLVAVSPCRQLHHPRLPTVRAGRLFSADQARARRRDVTAVTSRAWSRRGLITSPSLPSPPATTLHLKMRTFFSLGNGQERGAIDKRKKTREISRQGKGEHASAIAWLRSVVPLGVAPSSLCRATA